MLLYLFELTLAISVRFTIRANTFEYLRLIEISLPAYTTRREDSEREKKLRLIIIKKLLAQLVEKMKQPVEAGYLAIITFARVFLLSRNRVKRYNHFSERYNYAKTLRRKTSEIIRDQDRQRFNETFAGGVSLKK